jgi:ferredoxin
MATLIVEGYDRLITASPAISLLNTLLREGIPISHLCGGKAQCGTCRVKILDGESFCSPMGERERLRLSGKEGTLPESVRLACQTYIRGRVVVRILASGRSFDKKE